MPRRCEGESASAQSAATAGRELADVVQVEVDAVQARRCRVTGQAVVGRRDTSQPIAVRISRSASPAWVVRARPVADGDASRR